MDYQINLNPWAIFRPLPTGHYVCVGRFRTRAAAENHRKFLHQFIPNGNFQVLFDEVSL